jgi:Zn-dependent membrane protease YugP
MIFDLHYVLYVMIPTLIISGAVQIYLKSTYSKWRQVRNSAGETGAQVGQALFDRTSLKTVPFRRAQGELGDNFDPRAGVVNLSPAVATQPSVASMAIVAHELGHVQQHQERSALMAMRNFLVPAVVISPNIAYFMIFFGLILQLTGLIWLGVFFFALMVVFSIVTLPVEIDASRRGLRLLAEAGFMQTESDRTGARKVLTAAGLTYLGAAVTAILQLLFFISMARQ